MADWPARDRNLKDRQVRCLCRPAACESRESRELVTVQRVRSTLAVLASYGSRMLKGRPPLADSMFAAGTLRQLASHVASVAVVASTCLLERAGSNDLNCAAGVG